MSKKIYSYEQINKTIEDSKPIIKYYRKNNLIHSIEDWENAYNDLVALGYDYEFAKDVIKCVLTETGSLLRHIWQKDSYPFGKNIESEMRRKLACI